MDNQKDPFGTTPDQTNAGRTPNPSAAGSRKPAAAPSASGPSPSPSAQSTTPSPNTPSQSTANAGTDRQAVGEQTNTAQGNLLDTALNGGKKWIEDSGVLNGVNQLPHSLKDLGNRAVDRINGLSTTQKVVGGAILAAGLGWLATRKGKSSDGSASSASTYSRQRDAGSYGRKNYGYQAPDASNRPDSSSAYGNSRFGSSGNYGAEAGSTDAKSGSGRNDSGAAYGHASAHTDHGTQSSGSDYKARSTDYRSIE